VRLDRGGTAVRSPVVRRPCWSTARRCRPSTERSCTTRAVEGTVPTSPSRCAAPSGKPGSGISSRTPGPHRRGLPGQLDPSGRRNLLGAPHRQRRQPLLHLPVASGQADQERCRSGCHHLIDLPGRRSHEYFRSCPRTESGWSGRHASAGTITILPTTNLSVGGWDARRHRGSAHVPLGQMTAGRTSSSARQPRSLEPGAASTAESGGQRPEPGGGRAIDWHCR